MVLALRFESRTQRLQQFELPTQQPIGTWSVELLGKNLGAFENVTLDLFEHPRKQLPRRNAQCRFISQRRLQAWLSREALIPRDLGSAFTSQQERHLVLREARAL